MINNSQSTDDAEKLDRSGALSNAQEEQLAEILDNYLTNLEQGLPTDVESLLAENPHLAEQIKSHLADVHLLHDATHDLRGDDAQASNEPSVAIKQLGDYQLIREIGRGGMGVVYEARQISLDRQVALKVLPFAAVLDEKQIARFRNESQAAAQLHHPHIVPVFSVGNERGVHYYAMQYISGQSLEQAIVELRETTRFASEPNNLASSALIKSTAKSMVDEAATDQVEQPAQIPSARETRRETTFSTRVSAESRDYCQSVARLGVQVAEALHHAHEFGIVHRDIKPSNLLLDRCGKVWVADFGLARIQSEPGVTMTGDVVGTLRYMSPEQAGGEHQFVDSRTDIYSLGATLYELLTLRHAFDGQDRQRLLNQIQNETPPRCRSINPSIPIDLETIVMQAMAKSRDQRYASAQDLADDLQRFLDGKPTLARRPTLVDRTGMWARRHKTLVTAAAFCLVLLTGVLSVSALMLANEQSRTEAALVQADANFQQAQQNLQRAEKHFKDARQVVDHFGGELSDQLIALPGSQPLRRQILHDTLEYYRGFIEHAQGDPSLSSDLADTHFKAGVIADQLGRRDEAIDEYGRAETILAELIAAHPEKTEYQRDRAECFNRLGLSYSATGNPDEAERYFGKAIASLSALCQKQPENLDSQRQLAGSFANLGLLQKQTGEHQKAEQSLLKAVERLGGLVEQNPGSTRLAHSLAVCCNNLSFVQRHTDLESAEQSCRRAIAIDERLAKEHPESLEFRNDLAHCLNNLGALQALQSNLSDARGSYTRAIEIQEQLGRQAPAVVRFRSDLAISLNNLGQACRRDHDVASAETAFVRAHTLFQELVDDFPSELSYRSSLGVALNNQAMLLEKANRLEEAGATFAQAIENQTVAFDAAPRSVAYRNYLSKHYFNYGRVLRQTGQPLAAANVALERRKLWPDHGSHLFEIATELSQAVELLSDARLTDSGGAKEEVVEQKEIERLRHEAVSALRAALEAGYRPEQELETLNRFTALRGHPDFSELNQVIPSLQ